MKRLASILALLSLSISSFHLLRPKPTLGPIPAILLSPVKLLAGTRELLRVDTRTSEYIERAKG